MKSISLILILFLTELEVFLNMVGTAAVRLKGRLDLIYGHRRDVDGRRFSGLHETVLPLCSVARSIFDQLRNSTTKKASKKRVQEGAGTVLPRRLTDVLTGESQEWICAICSCCCPSSCLTCCRTRWTSITVGTALIIRAQPRT